MSASPDVSQIIESRIESFFNAVLNINDGLHLLQEEDLIIDVQPERRVESRSERALEEADRLLFKGKGSLQNNFPQRAVPPLKKAIEKYEKHFVTLIDFDKLVDAHLKLAEAYFAQNYVDNAEEALGHVVAMRPSVTFDPKKTAPEFIDLLTKVRNRMASFRPGKVRVVSSTRGATVYVDGISYGAAPATVNSLLRGSHFVQIRGDGMLNFGKRITAPARGGTVSVSGALIRDENAIPTDVDGEFISPESLVPYGESGNFGTNFFRAARHFCARAYVNFLLYGYVDHTKNGYELHLFMYNAAKGKMVSVQTVTVNESLGNLQMVLLDQEQALMKSIRKFQSRRVIQKVPPSVYVEGQRKIMAGVTVESKRPKASNNTGWTTDTAVSTTTTPVETRKAIVKPPETKNVTPPATDDPFFGAYPTVDDGLVTTTDISDLGTPVDDLNAWYEKWWVWTLVGVGVTGIGVGTAFALGAFDGGAGGAGTFTGTVQLP